MIRKLSYQTHLTVSWGSKLFIFRIILARILICWVFDFFHHCLDLVWKKYHSQDLTLSETLAKTHSFETCQGALLVIVSTQARYCLRHHDDWFTMQHQRGKCNKNHTMCHSLPVTVFCLHLPVKRIWQMKRVRKHTLDHDLLSFIVEKVSLGQSVSQKSLSKRLTTNNKEMRWC